MFGGNQIKRIIVKETTTKTKMKTLTITVPTGRKPGEVAYFTIEFKASDFITVLDKVEGLTSTDDVMNESIWNVK